MARSPTCSPARPNFGVAVPSCPDVPGSFLDLRSTWADPAAYDQAAQRSTAMFRDNFAAYADGVDAAIGGGRPGVGHHRSRPAATGGRALAAEQAG